MPKIPFSIKQERLDLISKGQNLCSMCNQILPLDEFHAMSNHYSGYKIYCKKCSDDKYRKPYLEKWNERTKTWQKTNRKRANEIDKKSRKKRGISIKEKMADSIRKQVIKYIKTVSPLGSRKKLIGCTSQELVSYLEAKFKPEWNWENYGKVWHIDHVIPCAAFDFSIKNHLFWCWNYRNLQPLDAKENILKCDMLPSGQSATTLKKDNPALLIEVLSRELEKMEIATADEVKTSYSGNIKTDYIII